MLSRSSLCRQTYLGVPYPNGSEKRWMKIRKILLAIALAIIAMHLWLLSGAWAQSAVEIATVRGHFAGGDALWQADDFGWFYYDLDDNSGGEELRIKDLQGRTAKKGDIVYSSRSWSKQFEYAPWGSYQVVALMGKHYLASYPESSFTNEVSSLAKGELREILRDEDREYTLTTNDTLPLEQGYSLVVAGASQKSGVVNFVLLKNGKVVHGSVVSIGDTFVYKVNEVPVILVHLANSMGSKDGDYASVDGIFQISDTPIARLIEGGILGNMKLEELSEDGIEFKNGLDLTLKRNTQVYLIPNLLLVVLDQPSLTYYPLGMIDDYGLHEIRGPTFSEETRIPVKMDQYDSSVWARWNAQNYSGFYFDPEDMLGEETLVLYSANDRIISPPSNLIIFEENKTVFQTGFQYTSILQPKEFEFKPWGNYYVINLMGMQWFAGYDSSITGTKAKKSFLEHEYLGKVLWDTELQGVAFAGNYTLQEGYNIRIHDVSNDSIFLELSKDGTPIESSVIKPNSTYVYEKDLGDVDDMPVIMVHVDNVFSNGTKGFATIDAIFQISDQYVIPVERGDGFGELQIVEVNPFGILMVNDDYIRLNRDSTIFIAPMMNIRVANNDTLRYYLFNSEYVVPAPGIPMTSIPDNVTSKTQANFSMFEQAAEIRQVSMDIVDYTNRTVYSRDITNLGQGSGEFWFFNWIWNATVLVLSDDKSQIIDVGDRLVPGLLRLNQSAPAEQVGVYFNATGRISRIQNSNSNFYVSRSEYEKLKVTSGYDIMLANETLRNQYIKINPGESTLEFQDLIDGNLIPSGINHTLEGTIENLEPHAKALGAPPGRYELRIRIENAVNAILATGHFFNVTAAPMSGIFLGSAQTVAGEEVSIPIEVPSSEMERRVNLTYNSSLADALSITGNCSPTWQLEADEGWISIQFPANCSRANLSFEAMEPDTSIEINVAGWSGFEPDDITDGNIMVSAREDAADEVKKSNGPGCIASLLALALVLFFRRKG